MKRRLLMTLAAVALGPGAAWAQVPAGGEFQVNTYTTGVQYYGAAAIGRDGHFVTVWGSRPSGVDGDVMGQIYDANGAPRGGEFRVNTYTASWQYPAGSGTPVAMRPDGRFVVAWTSDGQDGDGEGIFGQRFDEGGNRSGGEFQVNTTTTGQAHYAHVAIAPHGTFVVVWEGEPDLTQQDVFAQMFDATGNRLGGEFRINGYTTGDQGRPRVAMDAAANFVVVWQDRAGQDGSGGGVFGQRFAASGARVGGEFRVNTYTAGAQVVYGVARAPDGRFVVSWNSRHDGYGFGVFGQLYDGGGTPVGAEFLVNSSTRGEQPRNHVGMDDNGNFVVSWHSDFGDGSGLTVAAQRFRNTGARRGAEFQVNAYTTGNQFYAQTAVDAVGNFITTWDSDGQDGSGRGVFAQRFGGLVPNALAVDTLADANSDGNGVLEPSEVVDLRPRWRNVNGAAQTISGSLGNAAGPGSPAIVDSAASYGTIANGATQACADCYEVSIASPMPRPAMHWDVSAVETLLPDAFGEQKTWRLHVGASFSDVVESNGFYRFIETLLHHGVTGGCTATAYCPASATSREQMAVFVLVARETAGYAPPACTTPMFNDVPASSPYCRWIEELARRGVVGGCGGGNYCPASQVTREQMAVFVLRTLDPALAPPACTAPMFGDVPASSPFCRWIEELARRGVVTGCGGGNYCPAASVTREQMGVFISVTFGLALYGL